MVAIRACHPPRHSRGTPRGNQCHTRSLFRWLHERLTAPRRGPEGNLSFTPADPRKPPRGAYNQQAQISSHFKDLYLGFGDSHCTPVWSAPWDKFKSIDYPKRHACCYTCQCPPNGSRNMGRRRGVVQTQAMVRSQEREDEDRYCRSGHTKRTGCFGF